MNYCVRTLLDELRQSNGLNITNPINPSIQINAIASPLIIIYFMFLISFYHFTIQFHKNKIYPPI